MGKYKIMALCISRVYDQDTLEFVAELNKRAVELGFRLFIFHTCSDLFWKKPSEEGESSVFDLIDFDQTDVMVIYKEKLKNSELVDSLVSKAKNKGVPVVTCMGDRTDDVNVYFDFKSGFEAVVRHVIETHGKRKLHLISGIENHDISEERVDVFKKVAKENGIDVDSSMISYGQFWSEPARAAAEKIVESKNIPEAIICANDVMAIVTTNVLVEHGYRVPEDVLVTGFDGILETNFCVPKITTCFCSSVDLADKTAELAKLAADGEDVSGQYPIISRMTLSESCGCGKGGYFNVSDYLNQVNNRFYRYREEERVLNQMCSNIQLDKTLKDVYNEFDKTVIYNMCCMLNEECLDPTANPMKVNMETSFSNNMILLCGDDLTIDEVGKSVPLKTLLPEMKKSLEDGHPLLFNALNYQNIPLGYVCFHFMDFSADNYVKITQIVAALNNALTGFRNMRYHQYMAKQLEEMNKSDMMTGLYNRNGCVREFERMAANSVENSRRMTFIMSDLDMLKHINDCFGHSEGDNAICTVARALSQSLPEGAICARIGGDEMIAFFDGTADNEEIRRKINDYLECYNRVSGKPYNVSTSVGIYVSEAGEVPELEFFIKKADVLMYADKAKKKGARR